jgi:hypothetical protein
MANDLPNLNKAGSVDVRPNLQNGLICFGNGQVNYIPIWQSSGKLGNSVMYQNNSFIGIGTTNPTVPLTLQGNDVRLDEFSFRNPDYELVRIGFSYGGYDAGWMALKDHGVTKVQFDADSISYIDGGDFRLGTLSGDGNAYVCVNSEGILFRSETPC